jgi:hypothetical protein
MFWVPVATSQWFLLWEGSWAQALSQLNLFEQALKSQLEEGVNEQRILWASPCPKRALYAPSSEAFLEAWPVSVVLKAEGLTLWTLVLGMHSWQAFPDPGISQCILRSQEGLIECTDGGTIITGPGLVLIAPSPQPFSDLLNSRPRYASL